MNESLSSSINELNQNQLSPDNQLNIILNSNKKLDDELYSIKNKFNEIHLNIIEQNPINNLTDQPYLDDELRFKLDLQLRNKLILALNGITSLFYGEKNLNNKKEIAKVNNLIYNLVDLPLKLDDIQDNETNIKDNLIRPTLILDSKMRIEITDLLIKNKNYSILSKDKINEDTKLNLINENNIMINKLLKLSVQMIKVNNSNDDNLTLQNCESNQEDSKENELNTKLEDCERTISELKKEISDLKESNCKSNQQDANKDQLTKLELENQTNKHEMAELKKEISNSKESFNLIEKEINLIFEFESKKSIDDKIIKTYCMPKFSCLGLDWYLQICLHTHLVQLNLMSKLDPIKSISVCCELKVIDQYLDDEFVLKLKKDFTSARNVSLFNSELYSRYSKRNTYNKILILNMKADWI